MVAVLFFPILQAAMRHNGLLCSLLPLLLKLAHAQRAHPPTSFDVHCHQASPKHQRLASCGAHQGLCSPWRLHPSILDPPLMSRLHLRRHLLLLLPLLQAEHFLNLLMLLRRLLRSPFLRSQWRAPLLLIISSHAACLRCRLPSATANRSSQLLPPMPHMQGMELLDNSIRSCPTLRRQNPRPLPRACRQQVLPAAPLRHMSLP